MEGITMSAMDAERAIQNLRIFDIDEIGSSRWMKQHYVIEKLNLAAHNAVKTNTDNYVMSSLVSLEKMTTLLHNLLTVELWRIGVLPNLQDYAASSGGSLPLRVYFVLHHECVLMNLLECVLYHDYVAQSIGDDLIDLVDYCSRQVVHLLSLTQLRGKDRSTLKEGTLPDPFADDLDLSSTPLNTSSTSTSLSRTQTVEQIARWNAQTVLKCGVSSVAVIRFLSDYLTKLPLSVLTRILDTHDFPLLAAALIENPPTVRRIQRKVPVENPSTEASSSTPNTKTISVWEKLVSNKWVECKPKDLLVLTANETQPWLILHALLLEPDSRSHYKLSEVRKTQLLRVRKYLNEVFLDQIPILKDLLRLLEESSISADTRASVGIVPILVEEQAQLREHILSRALREENLKFFIEKAKEETKLKSAQAREMQDALEKAATNSTTVDGNENVINLKFSKDISTDQSADFKLEKSVMDEAKRFPGSGPLWVSIARYLSTKSFRKRNLKSPPVASSRNSGSSVLDRPDAKEMDAVQSSNVLIDSLIANSERRAHNSERRGYDSTRTYDYFLHPEDFPTSDDDSDIRAIGSIYTSEQFEELIDEPAKCALCGGIAQKRCSRCKNEWYCSRECQVKAWKNHKEMCDLVSKYGSDL